MRFGGHDVEAQMSQVLDKRNQGMKDRLVTGFSNTNAEVGKDKPGRESNFP